MLKIYISFISPPPFTKAWRHLMIKSHWVIRPCVSKTRLYISMYRIVFNKLDVCFDFPFSAVALWYVVQRTKLCLDFAATVHIFHLVICWVYNGHVPRTIAWWILNVTSVALMTVIGEFLCMRTEMKAIPLHMGTKVDLWFIWGQHIYRFVSKCLSHMPYIFIGAPQNNMCALL